jgi:hypothetical protein
MQRYMACIRQHDSAHHVCKDFSKAYLQCRMDRRVTPRGPAAVRVRGVKRLLRRTSTLRATAGT